jgi:hypothetical protein
VLYVYPAVCTQQWCTYTLLSVPSSAVHIFELAFFISFTGEN